MIDLEKKIAISTYVVDFLSLAVGPIHHAIEFTDFRRKYIGKFSGDILFSQVKQCHINLEEIKLQIFGEQEKAYNVSFKVLSHYQFYQSKKSVPKLGHKEHRKMIKAQKDEEEQIDTFTKWQFSNISELEGLLGNDSSLGSETAKIPEVDFKLSMDKIRSTSIQLQVWDDQIFYQSLQLDRAQEAHSFKKVRKRGSQNDLVSPDQLNIHIQSAKEEDEFFNMPKQGILRTKAVSAEPKEGEAEQE